jgi:hypothetical protein
VANDRVLPVKPGNKTNSEKYLFYPLTRPIEMSVILSAPPAVTDIYMAKPVFPITLFKLQGAVRRCSSDSVLFAVLLGVAH